MTGASYEVGIERNDSCGQFLLFCYHRAEDGLIRINACGDWYRCGNTSTER